MQVRVPWVPLTLVVVLVSLDPAPVRAGTAPSSARSQALGVAPLLLDDLEAVFQLPHRAVEVENQISVLGQGASVSSGSIAAVTGGRHRMVVVTQKATIAGVDHGRVYGVGWATSWRGIDLGLGVSGGYDSDRWESTEDRVDPDDTQSSSSRLSERKLRLLEGQIGVGSRRGNSFFDLAVAFVGSRREIENIDDFGTARNAQFRDEDVRLEPHATLRFGNASGTSALVVAGTWGRTSWDTSVSSTSTSEAGVVKGSAARDDTASIWSARAQLTRETGRGEVGVHLGYAHNEVPALSVWTNGLSVREDFDRSRRAVASLGIWLDAEIAGPLRVLGGASGRYQRDETETGFNYSDSAGTRRNQVTTTEGDSMESSFSWGATVETDRYRAVAMLDTRLDLEDLFWVLDVSYLF